MSVAWRPYVILRRQKVGLHRPYRSCVAPVDRTSGVVHGVKDAFCTTRNAATQSMVDRSSGPGNRGVFSAATASFSFSARCGGARGAFSPLRSGDGRSECAVGAGFRPGAGGCSASVPDEPCRCAGCSRSADSSREHNHYRRDFAGRRSDRLRRHGAVGRVALASLPECVKCGLFNVEGSSRLGRC